MLVRLFQRFAGKSKERIRTLKKPVTIKHTTDLVFHKLVEAEKEKAPTSSRSSFALIKKEGGQKIASFKMLSEAFWVQRLEKRTCAQLLIVTVWVRLRTR